MIGMGVDAVAPAAGERVTGKRVGKTRTGTVGGFTRDLKVRMSPPVPIRQHNIRAIPTMKKNVLRDGAIQSLSRNIILVEHLVGLRFLKYTFMM
jgi:hypothetical protein